MVRFLKHAIVNFVLPLVGGNFAEVLKWLESADNKAILAAHMPHLDEDFLNGVCASITKMSDLSDEV